MVSYKRPGGLLAGKPTQGFDGKWYNQYGEPIEFDEKDLKYSERFWSSQPKGMRETFMNNILNAANDGFLGIIISEKEFTEKDKERASAYRVLARQMGLEVGGYILNENARTIVAPIKRVFS